MMSLRGFSLSSSLRRASKFRVIVILSSAVSLRGGYRVRTRDWEKNKGKNRLVSSELYCTGTVT